MECQQDLVYEVSPFVLTLVMAHRRTVIMDSHPFFVTLIVIVGWLAKNAVSAMIGNWVGGDSILVQTVNLNIFF